MEEIIGLNKLKPGQSAYVTKINTEGMMRRRLLDIGLIENTQIECVGKSPSGDPSAYFIRGAVIAIREENSKQIYVKPNSGEASVWD